MLFWPNQQMEVLHTTGTVDITGKLALNVSANTHLSPGIVEVCVVIEQAQKAASEVNTTLTKQQHNCIKDYLLSGPSLEGLEIERDKSTSRPIEL